MLNLIWFKALSELRVEAARRYIGMLWWILEPILYMGAFYLVFSSGLRMGGDGFVPFLLCGLVPWKWFATTIVSGSNIIAESKGLMHQVYFHKSMLVGMLLTVNLLKALLVFVVLLTAVAFMGYPPQLTWIALPLLILLQCTLIGGIVSVTASIVPFVPDLRVIIDNAILILFFASGIFFNIDDSPEHIQQLLYLNPMAVIISAYRDVLMYGHWPDWQALSWVLLLSAALIGLGLRLIHAYDRTYPKVIM